MQSVLVMGGSGQAGAGTAALLRRWHPTLPLTIAGRDLGRAQRVADDLGAATAVVIDLDRGDLGLPSDGGYSAVVAALWDRRLHGLGYAQRHGVPYLSISNGLVDLAPEVIAGAQRAANAPILLASHYFAGLVVLAAMDSAAQFGRVDSIRVGSVLDETDAGGPAGMADLDRLAVATTAALIRRDGVFTWLAEADARAEVRSADGILMPAQGIALPDVPSLGLATGASNVRFDFAVGESAGRRRGAHPSVEVRIEIEGLDHAGAPLRAGRHLEHPQGQRPLTALGVALGVERLIGLRGDPVAPGIHTPETILDPADAVERMREIGTLVTDTRGDG
ncbi:saccharopine dehydrogenase [Nocardia wallacei]|uniref:saccharopine dehydrogenase n=1 Tax=Nocardia wallacei TaxID=480035 RepID=UPI0024560861|nr:saccharopine dehydrogenase [Nocardia wallacei]